MEKAPNSKSGICSDLTEISLIGLGLTGSDNSLTEGGDLG